MAHAPTPTSPSEGRPRVSAVVLNSVSHDSRVLKEAESLVRAGYDVEVFGIQDNRVGDPVTTLESGLVIRRADWKCRAYSALALSIRAGGILLFILAVVAYSVIFLHHLRLVAFLMSPAFIFAVGLLPLLAIPVVFHRKAWRFEKVAWNLRGTEPASEPATPRSVLVTGQLLNPSHWKLGPRLAAIGEFLRRRLFQHVQEQAMLALIEEFRPTIVHCHDLHTIGFGLKLKRRLGAKVVYDSHELFENQSMISRSAAARARRRQRSAASRLDGFITVNESIARTLRDRYPALPEPVVICNATPLPAEPVLDDGRLREAAGVPAHERILLYQGGFAARRGLEALVRAAPLLPAGWTLVMMGWGSLESRLRAVAAEVDPAGERIRFIPPAPREELAAWTAGGDLGVIPYENTCLNHWFCSPNKLWEYPVAGVPILASPFPELRGIIEPHGIGRLIDDPPSPRGIADAVAAITPEDLASMKANCRRFITGDNWSVYDRRLVSLYDDLRTSANRRVKAPALAPGDESLTKVVTDS